MEHFSFVLVIRWKFRRRYTYFPLEVLSMTSGRFSCASLLSSMGWVKHTDTYGMYEERIKPIVSICVTFASSYCQRTTAPEFSFVLVIRWKFRRRYTYFPLACW